MSGLEPTIFCPMKCKQEASYKFLAWGPSFHASKVGKNITKLSYYFEGAFLLIHYSLGCSTPLTVFQSSDKVDPNGFCLFFNVSVRGNESLELPTLTFCWHHTLFYKENWAGREHWRGHYLKAVPGRRHGDNGAQVTFSNVSLRPNWNSMYSPVPAISQILLQRN